MIEHILAALGAKIGAKGAELTSALVARMAAMVSVSLQMAVASGPKREVLQEELEVKRQLLLEYLLSELREVEGDVDKAKDILTAIIAASLRVAGGR